MSRQNILLILSRLANLAAELWESQMHKLLLAAIAAVVLAGSAVSARQQRCCRS